jgi:hypothetical protein
MSHFTEDPTFVIICGTIISLAFLIALIQTGRAFFIAWLVLALGIMVGLVLVERAIVTDREKIEVTLAEGADAVSKNDVAGALKLIASSQPKVAQLVQSNMKQFKFSEAYVITKNIELEKINPPSHATAVITCKIAAEGKYPYSGPIKLQLNFVREGEKWLVEDYEQVK